MASAHGVSCHSFRTNSGDTEHYIAIATPAQLSLARQIDALGQRYAAVRQTLRLPPDSAVFRRLYVSDALNQAAMVRDSSLYREPLDSPVAVSMVQQPLLSGAKVAMLAYHVDSATPLCKARAPSGDLLLYRGDLRHLWSTQLCTSTTEAPNSAAEQPRDIFKRLIGAVQAQGGTLADNCVRSWIYVKDMDVFYQDMVAARTVLVQQHGLTRDTHYLPSTGIEDACGHQCDVVLMDTYSISIIGLATEQVSYECL